MNNSGWPVRKLVLRLFEFLLKFYPPRFRREFSSEIQEIVLGRVRNAEEFGWMVWISAVYQEIMGLVPSIIRECWHEIGLQKKEDLGYRTASSKGQLYENDSVHSMGRSTLMEGNSCRSLAALVALLHSYPVSYLLEPGRRLICSLHCNDHLSPMDKMVHP